MEQKTVGVRRLQEKKMSSRPWIQPQSLRVQTIKELSYQQKMPQWLLLEQVQVQVHSRGKSKTHEKLPARFKMG